MARPPTRFLPLRFSDQNFASISDCHIRTTSHTFLDLKMAVFWDVTPCSLVDVERYFRETDCRHHQGNENMKSHLLDLFIIGKGYNLFKFLLNNSVACSFLRPNILLSTVPKSH
jgi:hypothetical protein